MGLGAGGSSGKTTVLMLGHQIGDSTGGIFRVGSGFSGVFGWVSISIVLIFDGSGFLSLDHFFSVIYFKIIFRLVQIFLVLSGSFPCCSLLLLTVFLVLVYTSLFLC